MPEAEPFEAPQGGTFFGRYLEAITEAFVGNGIQNNGDAQVTPDPNTAMGIQVAAATNLSYDSATYSPSSTSFTLSTGPQTTTSGQDDRRVDLVYFDSSAGTYAVAEGTPAPNPEPPETPSDGLLLALVAVPHAAGDVTEGDIHNWRAHPAASALLSSGFEATPGTTQFGPLFDIQVESNTSAGTEVSYTFAVDGEEFAKIYTESDGSGGIQNGEVQFAKPTTYDSGLLVTGSHPDAQADNQISGSVDIYGQIHGGGGMYVTGSNSEASADNQFTGSLQVNGAISSYDNIDINGDFKTFGAFIPKGGAAISFPANRTPGNSLAEAPVDSNASAGSAVGVGLSAGGSSQLWAAVDADGSGGVQREYVRVFSELIVGGDVSFRGSSFDHPLSGIENSGDEVSYSFGVAGQPFLSILGYADGSGGLSSKDVAVPVGFSPQSGIYVTGDHPNTGGGSRVTTDFRVDGLLTLYGNIDSTSDFETFGSFIPKGGAAVAFPANRSWGNTTISAPVDGSADAGREYGQSYSVGGGTILSLRGEADGSGGVNYRRAVLHERLDTITGSTLVDAAGTIQRPELSRPHDRVSGSLSRNVGNTTQAVVVVDSLADGETMEIDKATLTTGLAQAMPTGVNVELVTFDNSGGYTTQSTILSGDGSTVFDDETGSPLASYTNSTGGEQSVGVIVDNTDSSGHMVETTVEGRTGR
jgi:hypothetical protein